MAEKETQEAIPGVTEEDEAVDLTLQSGAEGTGTAESREESDEEEDEDELLTRVCQCILGDFFIS